MEPARPERRAPQELRLAVAERSGVADVTAEERDAAVEAIEARNAA